MMKNTGYILALCLTASGHVLAHDVWITGKQAENNITAEIGYGRKRLVRTVLIFTESSDQLSRATDRVPGLPASPGYVQ